MSNKFDARLTLCCAIFQWNWRNWHICSILCDSSSSRVSEFETCPERAFYLYANEKYKGIRFTCDSNDTEFLLQIHLYSATLLSHSLPLSIVAVFWHTISFECLHGRGEWVRALCYTLCEWATHFSIQMHKLLFIINITSLLILLFISFLRLFCIYSSFDRYSQNILASVIRCGDVYRGCIRSPNHNGNIDGNTHTHTHQFFRRSFFFLLILSSLS